MNIKMALKRLSDFYYKLIVALNYISVLVIFLMAIWVFADVAGRYLFHHPIPGTTELVKCYIVTIVFLGVTYTLSKNRHVRSTIILQRMSPTMNAWCNIFSSSLGVVIFILLSVFTFQAAWESWLVREFDGTQLKVPVYPSRFVVFIGSALMVIQCILDIWMHARKLLDHYRRQVL